MTSGVVRSTGIRRLAVAGAISLLWAAAGGDLPAAPRRITVQGRILSAEGEGLGDWPVLLIATQRYLELNRKVSGGQVATLARTVTDASGYFSFDLPRERGYQFWFLRMVEAERFDPIVYLPPEDIEITANVRRGRLSQIEVRLRHHPDWAEVERRLAQEGGPSTPRGRILRTLGLPEKSSVDPQTGDQEWWYFTRGILYTFRGPEPTGQRLFEPVAPPPGGPRGSRAAPRAGDGA